MVFMSAINFVSALFVAQDPPPKGLSVIDEEDEPRESYESRRSLERDDWA